MWKTFQNNEQLYMIKLTQHENIEVFLTDLKNIWTENISKEALLKQFQEMNPLFDIKIDEAVDEVTELVHHISDIDIEISYTSDTLELILKPVKSEFNMEYKFKFVQASTDTFLKEVTVPLIQTVKHLEEQQKMLCAIIQKKDRELEEYKLEKGQISRDDLITDKFDEAVLGKVDNKSMMNVFGSSKSFWESFVEQHGNITATIEDVKTDPWNHVKRKKKVYSAKTVTKKEVCNSNGVPSEKMKESFQEKESCVDSSKDSSNDENGFAVMEEESFEEEGHLKDEGKPDLQNEKKQCDVKQTAITKEDLRKEIVSILKTADLSKTSVKMVRETLEAKFQVSFYDRRLEIDCLVMEWLNSTPVDQRPNPVDKKKAVTNEDLRNEIFSMLKTAELSKTTLKVVRETLEAKFQISLEERKLEIRYLVMDYLNSPVNKNPTNDNEDKNVDYKKKVANELSKQVVLACASQTSSKEEDCLTIKKSNSDFNEDNEGQGKQN